MKKLILLSAMLVSSFALANSNQVDRLDSVFEAPCYKTTTTTTSNPDGSTYNHCNGASPLSKTCEDYNNYGISNI